MEFVDRASSHSRRVAGWASALAKSVERSQGDLAALREAAGILHLANSSDGSATSRNEITSYLTHGAQPHQTEDVAELAQILDLANMLDEAFETDAQHPGESDFVVLDLVGRLRLLEETELTGLYNRVPSFPVSSVKAINDLSDSDTTLKELNSIVEQDAALATQIVSLANSSLYTARREIRTVSRAIAQIGFDKARCVLLTSALRPMFSAAQLSKTWQHSMHIAQATEELAQMSNYPDPGKAFLAGLLHDIGLLLTSFLPTAYREYASLLIQDGCHRAEIEKVLLGVTHADMGSLLLRRWGFGSSLIQAVHDHHQVSAQSSQLAGLLFLAEVWSGSEEDLPSKPRVKAACEVARIDDDSLRYISPELREMTQAMCLAA